MAAFFVAAFFVDKALGGRSAARVPAAGRGEGAAPRTSDAGGELVSWFPRNVPEAAPVTKMTIASASARGHRRRRRISG